MLEYVLNTSTNVFCQYSPRREGLNRRAVLRSIRKAVAVDHPHVEKEYHKYPEASCLVS